MKLPQDPRVRWPAGLEPETSPVFAHNELQVAPPPSAIWAWLLAAPRWHEFYSNCWRMKLPGGARALAPAMRFTWWTLGVPVETVVEVFEPHRHLAWSGRGAGSRGYHAWLLEESHRGTRLVTEETQAGPVVQVLAPVLRQALLHFHQRWLQGLATVAKTGPPG